jgi:hypothetical protein
MKRSRPRHTARQPAGRVAPPEPPRAPETPPAPLTRRQRLLFAAAALLLAGWIGFLVVLATLGVSRP